MQRGFRIGRLFGIELRVDSSWLLIFALVTWSLTSLFSSWHPDWTVATSLVVAIVSAVFFFGSVLFHEMAHSLVARGYGIPVRDITLHMFGGVSNIEREPPTPSSELLIAIVGPIASIGLGVALMIGGAFMTDLYAPDVQSAEEGVARLGPFGTLVMWLGPVNVMVGLFNLIPGFPLDGGRILRSLLWRATGDLQRATRLAAGVGQVVGWAFVVAGVFMALGVRIPFFGRGLGAGIWLALIGLFLRNAAAGQLAGVTLEETLRGLKVSDLMRRRGGWVPIDLPVRALVDGWFMRFADRAYPVFDGARLAGMITTDDVAKIESTTWESFRVRDVMTPIGRLLTAEPSEPLTEALRKLATGGVAELPVLEHGVLSGMLFQEDIARWVERRAAFPDNHRLSHA
jgi:Zn-dependent protease/CBS domain-containing protein